MTEMRTVTIEADDGSTDSITVPSELLTLLAETDEETPASVIGDLVMFSCAQRVHAAIHHSHGEPSETITEIEADTMRAFEERFGASFGDLTGHSH